MTRKDYERLARALAVSRLDGHGLNTASAKYIREQWEITRDHIADTLAADNPRFDRVKFLNACGWAA